MEIIIKDGDKEFKAVYTDQQRKDLEFYGVDVNAKMIEVLMREMAKSKEIEAQEQMFKDGLGDIQTLTIRSSTDLDRFLERFNTTSVKIIISTNLIGTFSDYLNDIELQVCPDSYDRKENEKFIASYKAKNIYNTVYDFFVDTDFTDKIIVLPEGGTIYAAELKFV